MEGSAGMDILETDVLIIGGGFAGCWAALRAADLKATVTLVDKAYVSRSGASTMSGGITTCPLDSDDLDTWAEEFIVRGSYMCDQRWTYQLLEGQRERIKDYDPLERSDLAQRRRRDPPLCQPRHGRMSAACNISPKSRCASFGARSRRAARAFSTGCSSPSC